MNFTISVLLFIVVIQNVVAQTGTYRLNHSNSASCTIAIVQQGTQVSGDVFAWWNTDSGKNGSFLGKGTLRNRTCVLKSADDADCKLSLTFNSNSLKARFEDCMISNLPEDFTGNYKKVTGHTPGTYQVNTAKAYFYKTPVSSSQLKSYLIKGNKVSVDIENILNDKWVFVNYTNQAGKITNGYMLWAVLKQ